MTGPATGADPCFEAWLRGLEARHLARLRFSEVSQALRALSSAYVERRDRLARGAVLDGAGKRAAFALFYAPIHFLVVREILGRLPSSPRALDTIVDLGCGTGAAGAAWASCLAARPQVVGIDRHHWAIDEAGWTYRVFGLRARARQADVVRAPLPARRTGIVAAWLVDEMSDDHRQALLARLLRAAARGAAILIVEPIARRAAPWWDAWERALAQHGGRADDWRLDLPVPDIVRRLDRAAGLSHDRLTARSLWLTNRPPPPARQPTPARPDIEYPEETGAAPAAPGDLTDGLDGARRPGVAPSRVALPR